MKRQPAPQSLLSPQGSATLQAHASRGNQRHPGPVWHLLKQPKLTDPTSMGMAALPPAASLTASPLKENISSAAIRIPVFMDSQRNPWICGLSEEHQDLWTLRRTSGFVDSQKIPCVYGLSKDPLYLWTLKTPCISCTRMCPINAWGSLLL